MHNERFPECRRCKLVPKGDGLFQFLERMNEKYGLDGLF